jgi:hypothetical protein
MSSKIQGRLEPTDASHLRQRSDDVRFALLPKKPAPLFPLSLALPAATPVCVLASAMRKEVADNENVSDVDVVDLECRGVLPIILLM